MYQDLYNYLIDDKIEIYENDTLLIKFQKILLKYKRIISIILLIILLTIGYLCKIHELFLNSNSNIHDTCILNGGYKSVYASKIKHSASSAASSVKSGIINAPSNLKNFGARRAEDAKILVIDFCEVETSPLGAITMTLFSSADEVKPPDLLI